MSGDTGTPADGVPFENTAGSEWARKALGLYRQQMLQVVAFNTDGVVSAQIWGWCPRCGHDIDVQPTLTAPLIGHRRGGWPTFTGRSTPGGAGIPETIEVECGCGHTHPDAPTAPDGSGPVLGCGVSFHLPTSPPAPPQDP